ncbi:MAG: hypothetical protein ACI9ZH_002421, partial [Paracoccaceae bacterium]
SITRRFVGPFRRTSLTVPSLRIDRADIVRPAP